MALEAGILFDVGTIILVATFFSFGAKLLRQPLILAYLATGLFLGPFGLGGMGFSLAGYNIGINNLDEVLFFSELGIAFLLFGVGVETNFSKIDSFVKVIARGKKPPVSPFERQIKSG